MAEIRFKKGNLHHLEADTAGMFAETFMPPIKWIAGARSVRVTWAPVDGDHASDLHVQSRSHNLESFHI